MVADCGIPGVGGTVEVVEMLAIEFLNVRDVVGVIGLVGWLSEPLSASVSFVLFFFKNPSVCFICREEPFLLSSN